LHHLFSSRQILVPLSVALAVTLALWLTLVALSDLTAPLLEASVLNRYLDNGFCQLMLALFTTISLYAALQALGLHLDQARLNEKKRGSWLPWLESATGRDRADESPLSSTLLPANLDETLMFARAQQHQQNFAPIGFTIWVLPLLGFIGTVVGITQAIGGLEQSVGTETAAAGANLGGVLGGLRFAFDTTFVGLVLVIPTMLYQLVLRARAQWVEMALLQSRLARRGFASADET
jgi:biopolymer transport protein ExbB/TolQ